MGRDYQRARTGLVIFKNLSFVLLFKAQKWCPSIDDIFAFADFELNR